MTDELFDIFFSGKLLPDQDVVEVKQKVGQLFNADEATLTQLFSGKSLKIKKSVDMDTAIKYRVKFREMGAIVDIRPAGSAPPPAQSHQPQAPQASTPVTTTADQDSPGSGSPNESITEPESPAEIAASLAPTGSTIDETPPAPARQFNTDEFQLNPANSGTLEDYAHAVEAAPVPDISGLDISGSDAPLDESPAPQPLDINTDHMNVDLFADQLDDKPPAPAADIDTSSLTVAEANTGSLEEFDSRPEPVPIPDTSKIKLV